MCVFPLLHLLCLLCSVDSSRWFTWVVRVGAPSKILSWACEASADMYIFLSCVCFYCTAVYYLFFNLYLFSYFCKLLKLRFLTQSTLHLLILLNTEAKIFNTLFYSLIFLSC